jgi:hypothetical protein
MRNSLPVKIVGSVRSMSNPVPACAVGQFGSLLSGTPHAEVIGGLAAAGGSMAQGYIDDERRVDVQKQLSAMEEARQLRIQEAQERIRRGGAQFDTQHKIESAGPLARAQAGAATDPEVLAAERAKLRNTAVGGAEAETDPTVLGAAREKVRNEALAGEQQDVVDAEVAKNSRAPVTLSPGQERVVPQGKDRPDLVRKSSSPTVADLYKDGVRTDGGGRSGGGAAASNFDAKQWDSAFKPAPELVSWVVALKRTKAANGLSLPYSITTFNLTLR